MSYPRLRSDTADKLKVRREPLNSGGYTKGGMYFGTPNNLWVVEGDEGYGHVRAPDLAAAKRAAMREWPYANWGKKAVGKLVDDAVARLAKSARLIGELTRELESGAPYPDQTRALLKYHVESIPRLEDAVLAAEAVQRQNSRRY